MSIYSQQYSANKNKATNTSLSKIVDLINQNDTDILDVGCSSGYLDSLIKKKYPANITGIEINKQDATIAKKYVDKIFNIDIENNNLSQINQKFDVIILADILEHLKNPDETLHRISLFLKPHGRIIASIPNFLHYSVKIKILTNNWGYENYGLLDKTHLKFFSFNTIKKTFQSSSLFINQVDYVVSDINNHGLQTELLTAGLPFIKDIFSFESRVFQYIIVASKNKKNQPKSLPKNTSLNQINIILYSLYYKIKHYLSWLPPVS